MYRSAAILSLFILAACSDDAPQTTPDMGTQTDQDQSDAQPDLAPQAGTLVRFSTDGDAFSLPFPSDLRQKEDGSMGFTDFEKLSANRVGGLWTAAADDLKTGWGLASAFYFWFDAPIDTSTLPALTDSQNLESSSVLLINVDRESPEFKRVMPIECKFIETEGTYHAANQLACISPFGVLRHANTRYAAVLTNRLLDTEGEPIGAESGFLEAAQTEPYTQTLEVLDEMGLGDQVRAVSVFTTHDPSARHRQLYKYYSSLPDPELDETKPVEVLREYDNYIVLQAYYDLPNIQQGPLPYDTQPAGNILWDDEGNPIVQFQESVRVLITVPKQAMPEAGFPTLFYMHGSGGKALELLDRGVRAGLNAPAQPDMGPAAVIAPYGVAGFAADFPLHDSRFPQNPDTTGLKLYNLLENPRAMVDNFNVSANEISMHGRLMKNLEIPIDGLPLDPTDFPDGVIRFNQDAFATMGHSMGSTIGTPAMTLSNEFAAYIASGAGGLYMEVALKTQDPVNLAPLLKNILRLRRDEELDRFDFVLNTLQHVFDYADATVHAPHVQARTHEGVRPKHVYQPVGLQDRYFSPGSRASLTTAFEIPLVGEVLEPEAFDFMKWVGQEEAEPLPAVGQVMVNGEAYTGAALQFEPAYEGGGHYVTFDLDAAKAIYGCFLRTLGQGVPEVRAPEDATLENCNP